LTQCVLTSFLQVFRNWSGLCPLLSFSLFGFSVEYDANDRLDFFDPRKARCQALSKLTDQISKLAEPIVRELGLDLWDLEYTKEAGAWFLRLYIDKEEGISIDDCEKVSRAVDPLLDEADTIPGQYTFEVSSAGAERQLKRDSDFIRFMGHLVAVRLYAPKMGTKEHIGTLTAYDAGNIEIETSGNIIQFSKSEIAMVRLRIG